MEMAKYLLQVNWPSGDAVAASSAGGGNAAPASSGNAVDWQAHLETMVCLFDIIIKHDASMILCVYYLANRQEGYIFSFNMF